jgi:hypothetical protein
MTTPFKIHGRFALSAGNASWTLQQRVDGKWQALSSHGTKNGLHASMKMHGVSGSARHSLLRGLPATFTTKALGGGLSGLKMPSLR